MKQGANKSHLPANTLFKGVVLSSLAVAIFSPVLFPLALLLTEGQDSVSALSLLQVLPVISFFAVLSSLPVAMGIAFPLLWLAQGRISLVGNATVWVGVFSALLFSILVVIVSGGTGSADDRMPLLVFAGFVLLQGGACGYLCKRYLIRQSRHDSCGSGKCC